MTTVETTQQTRVREKSSVIGWARETVEIEKQAIQSLSQQLDGTLGVELVRAVELIHGLNRSGKGRVILSGVGKSGIVARKWAATFSSTGTPSFYLDPTEAAHGDLGLIRQDDLLILLSSSGETDELAVLLSYAKKRDLPAITATLNANSTLARSGTISLVLKLEQEACPLGLAPTASTTMMIALGDAMASCLMRLQGFTQEDFAKIHPGGSLGRKLLCRIADVMHQGDDLPVVAVTSTMDQVIVEMTRKKLGAAVVLDRGKLCGIVTDGDLRRFLHRQESIHNTSVSLVMSTQPVCLNENQLLFEARQVMEARKITQLVVVSDELQVVGLVHIHDLGV